MDKIINEEIANKVEDLLHKFIDESGATYALLTDMGGNLLFNVGNEDYDVDTLAVLSAANYSTTNEIANLINEDNFSLLFHRGDNENIHFAKISADVLMIVLFKPYLSLGLLRLKIANLQTEINKLIGSC
ncbi:MAG: roadblock/LC7 domain-containing protein [Pseudomonadota bacterium]